MGAPPAVLRISSMSKAIKDRLLPLSLITAGLALGYLLGQAQAPPPSTSDLAATRTVRAAPLIIERFLPAPARVERPRPQAPAKPVGRQSWDDRRIAALERQNRLLQRVNGKLERQLGSKLADQLAAEAGETKCIIVPKLGQTGASIVPTSGFFIQSPLAGLENVSKEDARLIRQLEREIKQDRELRLRALLGDRGYDKYVQPRVGRPVSGFWSISSGSEIEGQDDFLTSIGVVLKQAPSKPAK